MASRSEKRLTRSSDSDTTSQTKRKSSSTHQSPTAPNNTTMKKTDNTTSKTSVKTQTKLTPSRMAFVKTPSTDETITSRKIKQEKLDETTKTPSNKSDPISLSSHDEDELYSQDPYEEEVEFTKEETKTVTPSTNVPHTKLGRQNADVEIGGQKEQDNQLNEVAPEKTSSKQVSPHRRSFPVRGQRTLVSQGRGGRGGVKINPPQKSLNPTVAQRNPKTPINLVDEFEQEYKINSNDKERLTIEMEEQKATVSRN